MIRTGLTRNYEAGFHSKLAPQMPTKQEYDRMVKNIPSDIMLDCGARLYPLMNLTWGYVESICYLCKQMRLYETKKLTRQIKELKLNYDRFRQPCLGDKGEQQESNMGEWFEEKFTADFDKLFNGIDTLAKVVSENDNQRLICVAVHQALTLIEAVLKYARKCDERVRKTGMPACDYCFVQSDFLKMIDIVKKFPTAKDERFDPLRELSAKILENRLQQLEVWIKDGRVWMNAEI